MTPKGSGHQFVVHEVQDSGFRVPVPERTFQHFLISSENLLHSGAVFPSVPQEIEFNILRIKIKFGLIATMKSSPRRWMQLFLEQTFRGHRSRHMMNKGQRV
jgi:hypothetical protein